MTFLLPSVLAKMQSQYDYLTEKNLHMLHQNIFTSTFSIPSTAYIYMKRTSNKYIILNYIHKFIT